MSSKKYKCICCQDTFEKINKDSNYNMTKLSVIPSSLYCQFSRELGEHVPNVINTCLRCKRKKGNKSLWQGVKYGVFSEIILLKIFFKTYYRSIAKLTPSQLELLVDSVLYEFTPSNDYRRYKLYTIIKNSLATGNSKPWKLLEINKEKLDE